MYDLIFDAVGKSSSSRSKKVLKKEGTFISVKSSTSFENGHLNFLKELIEEGKLKTVIDRSYPLEQVAEAHRYVEKGHKKGNVILTVGHKDRA